MMIPPIAREIAWRDPADAFARLRDRDHPILLESATAARGLYDTSARYSYVACDPAAIFDDLASLGAWLSRSRRPARAGLPPFQGGAVGYFGYEMGGLFERLPAPKPDPLRPKDMIAALYESAILFDHAKLCAWIVSDDGFAAIDRIEALLARPPAETREFHARLVEADSRDIHLARVASARDRILDGDIFQANIALRVRAAFQGDAFDLYRRLRMINPAPFSAFLDFDGIALVSASPERFLRLKEGQVESRPIKGTRARSPMPDADALEARKLIESGKDRAENVMIVDLLRNDLAKVAEDKSVEVPELCSLESFASVHHLVSCVTARLRAETGALDLLAACFPGGSVTGAPKIRAMEVIQDLESGPRGPYCGSIAWIGRDGSMDSSIVIRTIWIRDGIATFQAGGGITARSTPEAEYHEAIAKAAPLARALALEKFP